jgi:hypothetical protein
MNQQQPSLHALIRITDASSDGGMQSTAAGPQACLRPA